MEAALILLHSGVKTYWFVMWTCQRGKNHEPWSQRGFTCIPLQPKKTASLINLYLHGADLLLSYHCCWIMQPAHVHLLVPICKLGGNDVFFVDLWDVRWDLWWESKTVTHYGAMPNNAFCVRSSVMTFTVSRETQLKCNCQPSEGKLQICSNQW